jgi:hypothetical protein
MARSSYETVVVLRKTAAAIARSNDYQWGHMGSCNCGFLAQEITSLRKNEIHTRAMYGYGDWNEQLNDYCPTSGLPMDELISSMVAAGFDTDDLKHLERLSDSRILRTLQLKEGTLKHNNKADVVRYLTAWSDIIEVGLLNNISLPPLELEKNITSFTGAGK